jgi:hypothetical protein
MWGFDVCSLTSSTRTTVPVRGIMRTKIRKYNNYVFVVDADTSTFKVDSGCFFPEFLSTDSHAVCGKAFEDLNSHHDLVMSVPSDTRLAVGYGTSCNMGTRLMRSIQLGISLHGETVRCDITDV